MIGIKFKERKKKKNRKKERKEKKNNELSIVSFPVMRESYFNLFSSDVIITAVPLSSN